MARNPVSRHVGLRCALVGRLDDHTESPMAIQIDREDDGRWIAEIMDVPGAMAYGDSRDEAAAHARALALRAIADRLDHGEDVPDIAPLFAIAA